MELTLVNMILTTHCDVFLVNKSLGRNAHLGVVALFSARGHFFGPFGACWVAPEAQTQMN